MLLNTIQKYPPAVTWSGKGSSLRCSSIAAARFSGKIEEAVVRAIGTVSLG